MALLRARESIMAHFRPLLNAHGLTEQQWRIIRALHAHNGLEFHELARIACLLPPSLSGMLTRLERMALLRRSKRSADQRRLHVALTRAGKSHFKKLSVRMELAYQQIELCYGKRQLAVLFSMLHAVRELPPPCRHLK